MRPRILKWHGLPVIDWDFPKPVDALICALLIFFVVYYGLPLIGLLKKPDLVLSTVAAIILFFDIWKDKK